MSVVAFEGIIQDGQIRLTSDTSLPEGTRVYVIVPTAPIAHVAKVYSPRLAHPEDAADFVLEIINK